MMGKVQDFVWLRWTLLCENPKSFFGMPALLFAIGLTMFVVGITAHNPILIVVLVYSAYALWLMAVVSLIGLLLFYRPDRDGM
jgi:hypothetical protein